jgi:two-component system sensor histidine kinase/response regulator
MYPALPQTSAVDDNAALAPLIATRSRQAVVIAAALLVTLLVTAGSAFAWVWSRGLATGMSPLLWLVAGCVMLTAAAFGLLLRTSWSAEKLRRQAELNRYALHITLPQLRALWENAPMSILLLDTSDPKVPVKIVDCNPLACEVHGYTRAELIGQSIDLIEATPWAGQHAAGWLDGLHKNNRIEGEGYHRRKDGTIFPIEYFTSLVVIDGHEYVIGMDRDATARKQAEQALLRERSLTRALFDNIPDSVYCKDRESRFLMVSRALATKFGVKDPAEVIGKTDFDFFKEEHARQAFEDEQRIIATGQPLLGVVEKETWEDGRVTWGLTTKMPLRDERGEITGTCGITKDVTQIREAEEQIKQAKEAAEAADRAKSEFLAVMSHEIRTPMNGVLGFTNLLLDTPLTTEQRDWLLTIRSSGESLLTLINDILDFSKIESGRMELEQHPVSVRRCVEEVLDLLWSKANEKKIELLHWIEPDVPEWIVSDGTRLRQVLVNVVGNAIKFTNKGEVEVKVGTLPPESGQPPRLTFAIRDTGEGIPAASVNRLFRPFSQADSSTTRRFGGTGLGLAISRSLAQLLGGDIELVSSTPQGSCFRFTIQATPTTATEDPGAVKPMLQPTFALEGHHALVVDDNEANRRILTSQLQRWGLSCEAFEHPADAIEHLRNHDRFDVALLDMMMPDMNGVELGAKLHELSGYDQLPLILLSSVSREELRAHNPADHFRVVLTKPIRQSALLDALNSTLSDPKRSMKRGSAPSLPVTKLDPELARHHPLRIVVAEDNAVNQKLIAGLLRRLGYQPRLVETGSACLEAVRLNTYDLVLMDCQMPEMDGYEATERIRRGETGERNRDLAIVALTASAMVGDREKCLQAGMNDYLTKPIQAPDLIRVLESTPVLAE